MIYSQHARKRIQQRSILEITIFLLEGYGADKPGPNGARVLYFSKCSKRQIRGELGAAYYSKIESHLNTYQVICGNTVVTVGRAYKKIHL